MTTRARAAAKRPSIGGPFVWTFDGPIATSLADLEDALRRAIVEVGDVASLAVMIELSLPAFKRRVDRGEALNPAWSSFISCAASRYGLERPVRVRHLRGDGPLATLIVAYRS
jgi:hypothetical protein